MDRMTLSMKPSGIGKLDSKSTTPKYFAVGFPTQKRKNIHVSGVGRSNTSSVPTTTNGRNDSIATTYSRSSVEFGGSTVLRCIACSVIVRIEPLRTTLNV